MSFDNEDDRSLMIVYCQGKQIRIRTPKYIDLLKLRLFIERCKYPQEGYQDEEVTQIMKLIDEEKKRIDETFE